MDSCCIIRTQTANDWVLLHHSGGHLGCFCARWQKTGAVFVQHLSGFLTCKAKCEAAWDMFVFTMRKSSGPQKCVHSSRVSFSSGGICCLHAQKKVMARRPLKQTVWKALISRFLSRSRRRKPLTEQRTKYFSSASGGGVASGVTCALHLSALHLEFKTNSHVTQPLSGNPSALL